MKIVLFAILSLCFVLSVVALSKDAPDQAPRKHQAAGMQLVSLMGTIRADGEKLRFVTDQRETDT